MRTKRQTSEGGRVAGREGERGAWWPGGRVCAHAHITLFLPFRPSSSPLLFLFFFGRLRRVMGTLRPDRAAWDMMRQRGKDVLPSF